MEVGRGFKSKNRGSFHTYGFVCSVVNFFHCFTMVRRVGPSWSSLIIITSLAAFLTACAALKCDLSIRNEHIREYVAAEFHLISVNATIQLIRNAPAKSLSSTDMLSTLQVPMREGMRAEGSIFLKRGLDRGSVFRTEDARRTNPDPRCQLPLRLSSPEVGIFPRFYPRSQAEGNQSRQPFAAGPMAESTWSETSPGRWKISATRRPR